MTKETVASVIETAPVRLTSDETRLVLRLAQTSKAVSMSVYGIKSLVEIGIAESVPMETEASRAKSTNELWKKLRIAVSAKDSSLAKSTALALENIESREEFETGYSLTALGKEVARGITVRLKR